ncbi:bifunctional lysylphosphatidylglycerol flippase/synthetase MprF [Ectopseudomonas mendocina]|uniref:Phosphatidylglycerol lysyltransferase n=1 Tax=Ectopseudomonas mendocina TaxID=300 RepID=A0ABD7S0B8_ECTME|nr:bifunctional lysylphosphatidylglycerol flippase/synthetase MprF [Pseudomonas mendocina]TRO18664.1 bifunctional lysylphosphatidylglycerol flippase/synthetase MprF [Pseudomonas mendocina]
MSRAVPELPVQGADAPDLLSSSQPGWLQRNRHLIGLGLSLLLFGLALVACWHLVREINPDQVCESLAAVSPQALLGALLATVLGFLVMLAYEWSASRYADVDLPPPTLALGGFCAFAIGNAVGLSALSGGSVRYRLYGHNGLGAGDVARMSLFASLSLGVSLPILAALAALFDLEDASAALRLSEPVLAVLAIAVLATALTVALLVSRKRLAERPAPGCWQVDLGRFSLRLPGLRMSLTQLLISSLDVLIAASVLYLLLSEAPPFSSFVLIYMLALAAGVLSHVPGGVGVFEAVLLAAFSSRIDPAGLVAAMLLYRLLYVVLPLVAAGLLLLAAEARRLWFPRQVARMASGMAVPLLALLVFCAGAVLLFSGVTPTVDEHLEALGFLMPPQLIAASHLAASLVGTLCLLLAQGLRRRLSAAWALTLVLLCLGVVLSLLKGFDWPEALALAIIAGLLALFRREFYRRSRLMDVPASGLALAATVGVIAASVWLLLFAYQDVAYSHQLWWQFELDANAPRGLRAALGSALVLLAVSLTWLLRATPPSISLPDEGALLRARAIVQASRQPEGGLALSGDKALLFHPDSEAFLMYARRGRSLVALFDPIGPPAARAELIWQFRDLCDRHHARPVFYQVRAENLPGYIDIGLTALKLGEEALVDLKTFDLASNGKEMKALRYTWNRGQRDGLSLEFHAPGQVPMEALQAISDAWLQGKNVREKGFSLGRFSPEYLAHFRVVVVRFEGRAVAFANLLECETRAVASLDLMRVLPDAPKSTMEFLMLGLIQQFQSEGYARFSLGMVPLAGLQTRKGAPLPLRLGALVFDRGENFYNFQGLRRFKDKFLPQWEPRYLAVPAGLDPWVALADTAALIAGGLGGLVRR